MKKPTVDYRDFRLNRLRTPEFSHVQYLLFWPIYGLAFLILERGPARVYPVVECALDAQIPFCEYFVIPYYLWFVYLGVMIVYSFFWDVPAFRDYMRFTMITYTITCIVYIVWPSCQELRPETFARENFCTTIVRGLYVFDTNTNVCPSLHVIGSAAVLFASWNSKAFSSRGWRILMTVLAVLISSSTVFLKQHSILNIAAAAVVCAIAYPLVFSNRARRVWARIDCGKAKTAV